jgi:hypothetical protein
MLYGVILLWFVLTAMAVSFVAIDIRTTPESPVLKWGFVLVTAYTGVFGAFLYVLGCREPLPGLHEQYVSARWRQALGSTMHCVAGDGVGILVGAAAPRTPCRLLRGQHRGHVVAARVPCRQASETPARGC